MRISYPPRRWTSPFVWRYSPPVPSSPPSEIADVQRAAAFRVALRGFVRESERTARKSGLTPQRYLLLLLVKGAEDGTERATISELAGRLHLAQSTVTELVDRSAQAGLVRRRTSAGDRRIVYVAQLVQVQALRRRDHRDAALVAVSTADAQGSPARRRPAD